MQGHISGRECAPCGSMKMSARVQFCCTGLLALTGICESSGSAPDLRV